MKWELAIVAAAVLLVAGVSRRLTDTPFTPAMAFVLIGLLVGPLVIDEVTVAPTGATVRTLAEATLAVVLFADASRIKLRVLRREYAVPLRLLGIGLPLTIASARCWRRRSSAPECRRGGRAGGAAGAHGRRPRTGGGHRAATAVADPAGAERRERAQRRDLRAAAADRAGGGRRRGQDGHRATTRSRSSPRRSATGSSAAWRRAWRPPRSSRSATAGT